MVARGKPTSSEFLSITLSCLYLKSVCKYISFECVYSLPGVIQSKTDHILILSYLEKKEETKEQEGAGVDRGRRREGRGGRWRGQRKEKGEGREKEGVMEKERK